MVLLLIFQSLYFWLSVFRVQSHVRKSICKCLRNVRMCIKVMLLSCRRKRSSSRSRRIARRLHSSVGWSASSNARRVLPHPPQNSLLRSRRGTGRNARARSVVRHRTASASVRAHAELQVQLDRAHCSIDRVINGEWRDVSDCCLLAFRFVSPPFVRLVSFDRF